MAVGAYRAPATPEMKARREQVALSEIVARCACGEEVFLCSLREAQAANEATNTLIRQAGAAHARKCRHPQAGQLIVNCETITAQRNPGSAHAEV